MVTLILLAGGIGSRMGSPTPKQFLPLKNKPIALHSFDLFKTCLEITEIVVVCSEAYRPLFTGHTLFANPGLRRQDSVYSGLLKSTQEIILTHDAARPFVELKYIAPLLQAVRRTGAAALGVPMVNTVKQCTSDRIVQKTVDRSLLWEVQSPQAVQRELFFKAFEHAFKNNLEVTDDLSLVEQISHPSEIVPSSPLNFKITTPFDLTVACAIN
jgi:2-C-methyl-D-erythritol 4-phosphate cytidylyltransferase